MRGTTKYPETFTRKDYRKYSEEETNQIIEALLKAMTPLEKMNFLGGSVEPTDKGKIGNAGYQWGVPRLGIPESVMYDGPAGVTGIVETTGLPQPALLGSTWDLEMAYEFGRVAAEENAACSGNYQLAPQVDVIRSPHFTRNKDMKSEDSYLVSKMSVEETKATQDQNVIATVKHFAVANTFGTMGPFHMPDNRVDEQTLHEAYLRPFEETVKYGGTGSMMNSYNRLDGKYATNSKRLNQEILRDQWGFKGSLMADWGSVHEFTLNSGMDLEMPYSAYNNPDRIIKQLQKGNLTFEEIDEAVRHILWGMGSAGLLGLVELDENGQVKEEPYRTHPIEMEWRYEEEVERGMLERNREVAAKIVEEGTILLKNRDDTLPLQNTDNLAVIGLGAKYPLCGQQQERSYGMLSRMISGAEALSEEFQTEITPYPAIDYLGEVIPEEVLFVDEACTKNGVIRTYGIGEEDQALKTEAEKANGGGAAFSGFMTEDEDGERIETAVALPEKKTVPANLGEVAAVDPVIDFHTNSRNYLNGPGGNAFSEGAYTWKTFLKAPMTGAYNLKLECIGGNASFLIRVEGNWIPVAESTTRENTQWPWDSVICTETGMGLRGKTVKLEEGQVYPILVYAEHTVIKKDLQIRMAWSTPKYREETYRAALDAAAKADTVLLYATNSNENQTQIDIMMSGLARGCHMDEEQQKLILDVENVMKPNAKLIVIVQSSNAIAAGYWADRADAILTAYHTGQEGSRVLAKIISGKLNPSGKLAQTWPKLDEDTPLSDTDAHYIERHLGYQTEQGFENRACEGIFFGYRWYDKYGVEPLFPFGHGLSYTNYEYRNLTVEQKGKTYEVSLDVENVGARAGDEIVQLYLGKAEVPAHIQMAEKQLAGFARVKHLLPGESRRITLEVDERALYYWDPAKKLVTREDGTKDKWEKATGVRKVLVGASSRDIRLEEKIRVEKE